MRHIRLVPLLGAAVALACGDDAPSGGLTSTYTLVPPATAVAVGQDSTTPLGVTLMRDGSVTIDAPQLIYTSNNTSVATVNNTGVVRGLSGGTAIITVSGPRTSLDVPVEVRPWAATSVELSVMSGPAGGLLATTHDTGTFYALPADPPTARLRATVSRNGAVLYCNYCSNTPARANQRVVRFRSLDPSLATVSNAADPTVYSDTAGKVTVFDTSATGVKIVLEVPGDGLADTVTLKLALRPIDSIIVRPDSAFFPSTNGNQGLQYRIWPNSDTSAANVNMNTTTNFNAGVTFLSRTQPLPAFGASTPPPLFIDILPPPANVTELRPNLPQVLWESANVQYLTINAAGAIVAPCAFIGGTCPTAGSTVLNCNSNAGTMPFTFNGIGQLTIPNCVPTKTIDMPGANCTTANSADQSSTCTIWIRATATDPATQKVLRRLYKVIVRR